MSMASLQYDGLLRNTCLLIVAEIETTVGNIDERPVGCCLSRQMADQFQ